jgi:NADPH:quinone reductase-like Zn-dependent oxidoreductase
MKKVRAYSITAEAIAQEKERVAGDLDKIDFGRVIRLDDLELREMGRRDVHFKVLAVSGEHNVDHAVLADTINIVEARGGKIYPGNSAVGEVLAVGDDVADFKPGDIVVTNANGDPDRFGYPNTIWAYDTPDSIGWYAEEAVVAEWQVHQAPLDCGLSLWEMAALPLRASTAYHLWRRGVDIHRVKVTRRQHARLNVMSFGGGVGELFLMLARSEGHRAFFCSRNPERRAALEELGIEGIDQSAFNGFASRDDMRAFSKEVKKLTNGEGMQIVCDMLRGPLFGAGLAAASRMGVNVSAGWQLSQQVSYNSTLQSVKQVTIDHVHLASLEGCAASVELYGTVFKPTIHKEVYSFEDLPRAMHEMNLATQTGIPIVRVAKELPEAAAKIA